MSSKVTLEDEKTDQFESEGHEAEKIFPIHGDLLETTLSYVPLIDLIAASCVSKSWNRAVSSSLTHIRKVKPWLLVHSHSRRRRTQASQPITTHAFDPQSKIWIKISADDGTQLYGGSLQSFGSDFLYALTSTTLSFSHNDDDPLHLTPWSRVPGPTVTRIDPIVARVGTRIVVAGSGWEFDGDPLAVEVFDPDTTSWRPCQPMPVTLKDSAPATSCLSVATNRREMFVTEKESGTTYAFDPETGEWRGPFDLRPDPRVFSTDVGFVSGDGEESDMIVAGLIGHAPGSVEGLGIWRVVLLGEKFGFEMIGEAPEEILERWLKEEREDEEIGFDQYRSIGLSAAEGMVYVYDPSEPETVVFCELSSRNMGSRDCVWGSTRNLWWKEDAKVWRKVVFTCGRVEIGDLKRAITNGDRKFRVLERCR